MSYGVEEMARACHALIRELQIVNGEPDPVPPWDDASAGMRLSSMASVRATLAGATPQGQHAEWSAAKRADGWACGPVKDAAKKQHPCLVPSWNELPFAERVKDAVFAVVTKLMTGDGGEGGG